PARSRGARTRREARGPRAPGGPPARDEPRRDGPRRERRRRCAAPRPRARGERGGRRPRGRAAPRDPCMGGRAARRRALTRSRPRPRESDVGDTPKSPSAPRALVSLPWRLEDTPDRGRHDMRIGIPREGRERLVAATPATVAQLRKLGYDVVVEQGAGECASYPDEAYADAGASVVD